VRNKKVKDKETVTKPVDVGLRKVLLGKLKDISSDRIALATDPEYKNGKRKGAAKITCPYRTNRHHREFRQADSEGSMPMAVEDIDPH
jgi:hypothetical protein